MESFYGGRPGNPFILKGVRQEGEDNEFATLHDIQTAINNNKLKYGEYAIISPSEGSSADIGKIYRVNEKNQAIYMGRILAPTVALSGSDSSGISMVSPTTQNIPSLNLTTSVNDQTIAIDVKVPWTEPNINMNSAKGYSLTYEGNNTTSQNYYKPNIVMKTPPPVYIATQSGSGYNIEAYWHNSHLYPGQDGNSETVPSAGSIIFVIEDESETPIEVPDTGEF